MAPVVSRLYPAPDTVVIPPDPAFMSKELEVSTLPSVTARCPDVPTLMAPVADTQPELHAEAMEAVAGVVQAPASPPMVMGPDVPVSIATLPASTLNEPEVTDSSMLPVPACSLTALFAFELPSVTTLCPKVAMLTA